MEEKICSYAVLLLLVIRLPRFWDLEQELKHQQEDEQAHRWKKRA